MWAEARQIRDRNRGGNRVTFGRYTGLTPVAGREEPNRIERLREQLLVLDQQRREVLEGARSDGA